MRRLTGAQLRRLPPTPIPPERDLFQVIPGHPDRKIKDDDTVEGSRRIALLHGAEHHQPGQPTTWRSGQRSNWPETL